MSVYELDGVAPEIDPSVWIAPSATVIGQVRLGAECGVWFNAVLRGDTDSLTLGPRTNIQDNAVLHTDAGIPLEIGAECTIGHSAIVHGCRLGDRVLVGMGATVLNGARIGADCLIGANALVTEGKSFPAGSLIVGAPAKLARPLADEEIAGLRASAARYVANAARYKAGLRAL